MTCCCCINWIISIFLFFGFFKFNAAYNRAVAEGVITVKAQTPMFIFLTITVIQFFSSYLGPIGAIIAVCGTVINVIILWKLRSEFLKSKKQTENVQVCLKWCQIFLIVSIINAIQIVSAVIYVSYFLKYFKIKF